MSVLEFQDRFDLIGILTDIPELQNEEGRRQALKLAGLGDVLRTLRVDGAPLTVLTNVVTTLENYGRVTFDQHALGRYLAVVSNYVASASDQRRFIDRVLTRYGLMRPSVEAPPPEAKPLPDFAGVEEKIIGENTLRSVAFLARGLAVARSVAKVELPTGVGSGFLVSRRLFVTCNHVLPDRKEADRARFLFNFEEDFEGRAQNVTEFSAAKGGVFHTNTQLDYAVVELQGQPGNDWGIAPLATERPRVDDRVNIIQHPSGLPKRVSIQNNYVQYIDDRLIQYLTSTLPGSSGAPVLDDRWRAVAVHHAGGDLIEPGTSRRYFRNEGTLIDAILADLPSAIRDEMGKS